MKKIVYCLFILMHFSVSAQNKADLIQMADEIYKFGDYKDALDIYKQVIGMDSSDSYAHLMAGKCYLETAYKVKALPYLLNAYQIDHHACFNVPFLIGNAYQLNYNFDAAVEYYKLYKIRLTRERVEDGLDEKEEMKKTERRIFECGNGKEYLKHATQIMIENLSNNVNSEFSDYAPVVSADESIMFFTSKRAGSTGGNKDNDNEYFEDIYFSKKENGEWKVAENAGSLINSNLHESCIGITSDGKQIFLYKDDDKNTGDIFYSKLDKKNQWTKPKPLSKKINSEYIENSISISFDGKMLFFSSNRPGGIGATDLYYCTLEKNGDWSEPVNLGDKINTTADEESPFFYQEENTLYFSSRGLDGMGGFDVYKSIYNPDTKEWGKPQSLGYPINSPDDDVYFVLSGDGKYGYYSSVKEHCYGDIDLYRIHMQYIKEEKVDSIKEVAKVEPKLVSKKQPELKQTNVTLNIKTSSEKEKLPLDAKVRIFDLKTNKLLAEGKAKNGAFNFQFKSSKELSLVISAEKDGYIFKSDKLDFKPIEGKESIIEKNLYLSKVNLGYRAVLRNIYFEFDKATLKPESKEELDRLYNFMKSNPKVTVEIEGHTDNKGSIEYNNALSYQRSTAVINYLINKGIEKNHLIAKGYGELRPMASNDDEEEGRELNRRTEFLIKGK